VEGSQRRGARRSRRVIRLLSFFLVVAPLLWSSPVLRPRGRSKDESVGKGPVVSILAGSGFEGWIDGSPRTARFSRPSGVAVDGEGDIVVADFSNHVIRRVLRVGWVSTFAGNGTEGFADGIGKSAQFYGPNAVALGPSGELYVSDAHNFRIRRITPDGRVSTVAGSGVQADGEGPALRVGLVYPTGIVVEKDGSIDVADRGAHRIKRITADGTLMVLAGTGKPGYQDGPTYTAEFNDPMALTIDDVGNLYVADGGSHVIRRIDRAGMVTTTAGSGVAGDRDGTGREAQFLWPAGLAWDGRENLYVSEGRTRRIRKIKLPEGRVTSVADWGGPQQRDPSDPPGGYGRTCRHCRRPIRRPIHRGLRPPFDPTDRCRDGSNRFSENPPYPSFGFLGGAGGLRHGRLSIVYKLKRSAEIGFFQKRDDLLEVVLALSDHP